MPEALPHCPGGDMHVTSEWRAVAGQEMEWLQLHGIKTQLPFYINLSVGRIVLAGTMCCFQSHFYLVMLMHRGRLHHSGPQMCALTRQIAEHNHAYSDFIWGTETPLFFSPLFIFFLSELLRKKGSCLLEHLMNLFCLSKMSVFWYLASIGACSLVKIENLSFLSRSLKMVLNPKHQRCKGIFS